MIQITPELLREAGEALYGPRWKKDLASDLAVNERTIRRWSAGEWPVPDGLAKKILELIEIQALAVAAIRKKLRSA